ncbi:zinc metalloprotease [Sphingomonas paeninsulae]|uniref:Zinc metalloprotease n=1 Tax=Sphingomonas paeninsulae TaxID=2319844 RepID=A0A494TM70_SPHPE|nr:neutral zinc metallopeptidase [Sphingomonas paeninsulae]AYJ86916.1 zinc metalloprotease [Sphingomonas paeninsulae]
MRLDDESESTNFEIQSEGQQRAGFGGGGGLGMLGMIIPFVFSRFGIGGIVVLGIVALVFGGIGGGGGGGLLAPVSQTSPQQSTAPGQLTDIQRISLRVLGSTERRWTDIFAKSGQKYTPTTLVFYTRNGTSGCGAAQSAMGPFYCPSDQKIYLDTEFFNELKTRFNAPGDFPIGYVIAHEVGHHIQDLTGIEQKVRSQQARASKAQGNALQVAMELQADCYAGVWAANDKNLLEAGDVEEGMRAAQAIGDDTLQRASQGVVVPESFTHGSAAQRQQWLKHGLDTGDPTECNTFNS